jgi:hypothetical protein
MTRLADGPPRADSRVDPSPKHPFGREPLLIPQLFVNVKPWYRRREYLYRILLAPPVLLVIVWLLRNQHWLKILKRFARLFHR